MNLKIKYFLFSLKYNPIVKYYYNYNHDINIIKTFLYVLFSKNNTNMYNFPNI